MTQTQTQSVLTSSTVMAVGTVLSRLTGFVRAALLAAAIGLTTAHADIFNVPNTIPNSLYILVAGGIFNAVLVPQLVRAMKNDPDGGDAYANRIITLGALVLVGVTVVLLVLAPLVLRLYANGEYFTDPTLAAERQSLINFARWCMPQIFFYGMFVLFGQILNARGKFGPMMWTPIANNVVGIATIVAYLVLYSGQAATGGYTTRQEILLGLGSTVGIAVQTLLLLPYLRATGFSIRPRFDFKGTGLSHTARLGMWTIGFVIVNQIAYFVMTHRATSATVGSKNGAGYTVYSNAFLLTQVPHSVVTVSLATAMIPLVSRLAAEGRIRQLAVELSSTLRLMLSIMLPFAVALAVLGPAIATVLFSWGKAAGDTTTLGTTLVAFAPGLLLFSVHYVLLRGFYALEDTRTPFYIQCLIAAVNIVLAITLTIVVGPDLVAPMLALAYSASYLAGAVVAVFLLAHRLGGLDGHELVRFVVRVLLASITAAISTWVVILLLEGVGLNTSSKLDALVLLVVGGGVGICVYVVLARLMHIREIAKIVGVVTARLRS
ncbi:MAG: murein biosynthesis integral membrane protein MurJ [Nocardioidaceae bacterium]